MSFAWPGVVRAAVVAPATTTADSLRECARTLTRYLLGADVFNSVGKARTTYVATAEDALWDRQWLLADIFHSSPVVVDPPLPRTGVLCKNGLSNQCLESLWGTPTDGGETGYAAYSLNATFDHREYFYDTTNSVLSGSWPRVSLTRNEKPLFGSAILAG